MTFNTRSFKIHIWPKGDFSLKTWRSFNTLEELHNFMFGFFGDLILPHNYSDVIIDLNYPIGAVGNKIMNLNNYDFTTTN